jgi:3-oxoacyl-[acyl-carrier-protein] synthase II
MDVVVTGMGVRSALGDLRQTWQSLCKGQSGIKRHQPFAELPPRPLGLLGEKPAEDLRELTEFLVKDAIVDAGLSLPLPDCGVVVGSSRGQQTVLEQMLAGARDRSDWLVALPHMASVTVAQLVQTHSIVLSPMAACATGIWAIARGYELIASGQCEQVIAGAVETPITRLTLAGFEQMGAMAQTGCYPFDAAREGLVLGEGGAIVVLESLRSAQTRQAPQIYGRICGFGLTADAYHLSSPQPEGKGAIAAIQQALQMAGLAAHAIDYIHAHGTGTPLNDVTESQVITQLFPHQPWVSSTKGATGHTLGASGAIGVALSLLTLHSQTLPSCVGLTESPFGLNFVRSTQTVPLQHVLCNAFGFGGQNGAIVMSRYSSR